MITVAYPKPDFKTKTEKGRQFIFCLVRKRWIVLTPEEWVRQNFIAYLISVLDYPLTLIAVEKEINLGELNKRFDILVYDKVHKPWMLVECKEPQVALNEGVLQQVLRYGISVPAVYLVITNGEATVGWKREEGKMVVQERLPEW